MVKNIFLKNKLAKSLKKASEHHHNYEKNKLRGKRDNKWSGWYAGYLIGRIKKLQKHLNVSKLVDLLEEASEKFKQENWAEKYAEFIVKGLKKKEKTNKHEKKR